MPKHYSQEAEEYATGVHNCTAFIGLFIIMAVLGAITYFFWMKTIGPIEKPSINFSDQSEANMEK